MPFNYSINCKQELLPPLVNEEASRTHISRRSTFITTNNYEVSNGYVILINVLSVHDKYAFTHDLGKYIFTLKELPLYSMNMKDTTASISSTHISYMYVYLCIISTYQWRNWSTQNAKEDGSDDIEISLFIGLQRTTSFK